MSSIQKRPDGKYRARYRDAAGKEHARHFDRKVDARAWLDQVSSSMVTGTYVTPKNAKMTVDRWCETWLEAYGSRRGSTVRQAKTHLKRIRAEFGPMPLGSIRP